MSTNKKVINGQEYLLLPVEILGIAGESIRKSFELGKRHMEYVAVQAFVEDWIKRDVHWVKNKENKDVACYAVTMKEYKTLMALYNDSLVPF